MAVVPKMQQSEIDEIGDITTNLHSLSFESALSDTEKDLIGLRKRSHALSVIACAQATYFISVVNEARDIKTQLHNPNRQKTIKLMKEEAHKDPLLIADLQQKGVVCVNNNVKVARSVHILFICVLPSQLQDLAVELKGQIPRQTLVYSFISSINVLRLKRLLKHTNLIKPNFHFTKESSSSEWNYALEVASTFRYKRMLEKTCPINNNIAHSVVWTDEKFLEQLMYAFVNLCTSMSLRKTETVDIINAVLFKRTTQETPDDVLETWDISSKSGQQDSVFPYFDLSTISSKETPILRKIRGSKYLRQQFVNKYCEVFHQYLEWKTQALQLARAQMPMNVE